MDEDCRAAGTMAESPPHVTDAFGSAPRASGERLTCGAHVPFADVLSQWYNGLTFEWMDSTRTGNADTCESL